MVYEERGARQAPDDPAVVLWPSLLFDGGMWKHQIELLAALGRVVVFDGPGHGKSEVPPPFSLEDNADALTDAFAELQIDKAVFVGLSWGGMVGMRLALQHPQRVRASALLDTNADPEERLRKVSTACSSRSDGASASPRCWPNPACPDYFTEGTRARSRSSSNGSIRAPTASRARASPGRR